MTPGFTCLIVGTRALPHEFSCDILLWQTSDFKPDQESIMNFDVTRSDSFQIISAKGDVHHAIADEFKRIILEQLDSGCSTIVLDFSEAGIIDSSGIGAIVAAMPGAKAKQIRIILAGCGHTVKRVFQMIGFDQHFTITSTLDEALKPEEK